MSGNWGVFRSGSRVYTTRPPANCRSARQAWDLLSAENAPPIKEMHLMDGYWMCEREDGELDECENTFELNRRRQEEVDPTLPAEASGGIAAARPLGIGQREGEGCRDA